MRLDLHARRRLSLVVGLACLSTAVVPAVTAAAQEEPGAQLQSYALHADAPSFRVRQGTEQTEVVLPQSLAQLRNGPVGFAQSSTAWPGTYAGNVGSLLILAANAPPEAVALNSPLRAEARTGSGPSEVTNTDFPGTTMKAAATAQEVAAETTTGAIAALPVGDLGRSTSRSRAQLTGARTAVTEATSVVRDISLLDGQITIGAVTSTARATTDGTKTAVEGRTVVSGLTVAGQSVGVGSQGITAAGQDGPAAAPAVDAANSVLSAANAVIALSEPIAVQDGGNASYTAGSLVLSFTQSSGAVFSVLIGGANVSVAAVPGAPLLPLPEAAPLPVAQAPAAAPPSVDVGTGEAPLTAALPAVDAPAPAEAAQPPQVSALPVVQQVAFPLPEPLSAAWLVLAALGALLVGAALRTVPEAVLAAGAVARPCPLEERP
jgi:hypothetical protein